MGRFLNLWGNCMADLSCLPKYLIVYGKTDHRLAYSAANVKNSLRGVCARYGAQAINRAAVLALPGYEDVTPEFIVKESEDAPPF